MTMVMNTRICLLGCVFVVFVMLLWVSYIRKEKYAPADKQEKYGMLEWGTYQIWTSNYLSNWKLDWNQAASDNTISFNDMVQMNEGGAIIYAGLGSDFQIWTSYTLTNQKSNWGKRPTNNGIAFKRIFQVNEGGTLIYAGLHWQTNQVWTSYTLTNMSTSWGQRPTNNGISFHDIIQVNEGGGLIFAGIAANGRITTSYTLTNMSTSWGQRPGDDIFFYKLMQLRDGTFAALEWYTHQIWTSNILSNKKGDWTRLPANDISSRIIFPYYE